MIPPLTVVLPVWNEQHRLIAGLTGLSRLKALIPELEAIVVDDGSTDSTLTLAQSQGPPWLIVLPEPHRGKGGALKAGVARATGSRILVADIDWSVAPESALDLLKYSEDVVCAVREGLGARRVNEPLWRHMMGRIFNTLVQSTVLAGHADTQCGFKMLKREVAQELYPRLSVEGWAYDVELLTLAHLEGYSVRDVPVVWRHEEESRLKPGIDSLQMMRDVYRIQRRIKKHHRRKT